MKFGRNLPLATFGSERVKSPKSDKHQFSPNNNNMYTIKRIDCENL